VPLALVAQSPGSCAAYAPYFYQRRNGAIHSRYPLKLSTMTALKLSALFGGSLLAIFIGSLAVEDQRHFIACRATGASADACLLQLSGR
jgi:hypothetical protein